LKRGLVAVADCFLEIFFAGRFFNFDRAADRVGVVGEVDVWAGQQRLDDALKVGPCVDRRPVNLERVDLVFDAANDQVPPPFRQALEPLYNLVVGNGVGVFI
jgi:hypothetical protein